MRPPPPLCRPLPLICSLQYHFSLSPSNWCVLSSSVPCNYVAWVRTLIFSSLALTRPFVFTFSHFYWAAFHDGPHRPHTPSAVAGSPRAHSRSFFLCNHLRWEGTNHGVLQPCFIILIFRPFFPKYF